MDIKRKNSNKYIYILLISVISYLFFNPYILLAQENEYADSLFNSLGETNKPVEKFRILLLIKDIYDGNDSQKAMQYARLALMEAENSEYTEGVAEGYSVIGELYEAGEDYNKAIENYRKAYDIYSELGDENGIADVSFNMADVYKKKGYYQLSMERCLEGLGIYEGLKDSAGMAGVYNCMGSLFKYQDNNAKALEYYSKSLDLRKAINDLDGIALSYNNIGVVYSRERSYDLALDFYEKAVAINQETNDLKSLAINYNNIANIYLSTNEFDKAYEYINLSLETNNKVGYARGVADQTESLGRYYYLKGNFSRSIEYYLEAFDLYRNLGRLGNEMNISSRISEIYYQMGENQKAYEYLKLNQIYRDSIFDIEKMKNIASLEMEFKQHKEKDIHDLKEQRRIARNTIIGITLFFLLITSILLLSRQRIKNRQQALVIKNIELEKKQVESDLEQKQKELAAGTIYRVKKNEMLSDIVGRLNDSLENLKNENVPVIKNIIEDLKSSIDSHIWDEFEKRFLDVHKGFYDNLASSFPQLTTNEKRIAAFLRLDFSTKEISSITNQSPHSINIARTRLRKKLGLANTDTNLSSFLAQF